jgi:CRISPR/Cas system-associated endoribonuclease Cas2
MEENKIYLINQIDVNKIIYSKINEMNDKKLIQIFYEKPGQKLLFQTPQLLNIFDIQKNKYFNELILPLYDCNLKVPLLIQFLKDLDSKIIDSARINKNEWFKNKTSIRYKSLIKNLYTSNTHSQNYTPSEDDKKYSQNGLLKLKLTNGVKILENGNEISLDKLNKNSNLRMIVELYGVWVSNDVFGVYLKPVMIEQIENKTLNFIDDKEDITEVNYLETEANSEDEFLDKNEIVLKNKTIKNISETSNDTNNNNNKEDDTKMYQFGLHDVNEDLFNTLKKDKKIISILSELNSNNTKRDINLSDMSSEIEDMPEKKLIKEEDNEEDSEEDESDESEKDDNDSETSLSSDYKIKIKQNVRRR